MRPSGDELAGVVDLFGGLTRAELRAGLADLAARAGEPYDETALEAAIADAVAGYYLVELDREPAPLLVPGPTALPTLPPGGEDLPHLLDVEARDVDRGAVGAAALERLRAEAARAVDEGEAARVETLLDVCYDLEAWAPVETDALRERLDAET